MLNSINVLIFYGYKRNDDKIYNLRIYYFNFSPNCRQTFEAHKEKTE